MIIKIIIGIGVYIAFLVFTCIFFKGATELGNNFDEKREVEEIFKRVDKKKF